MRTHVVHHPLVAHKLTVLRDEQTDSPTFRRLAEELVTLLAYEATREVRTETVSITTPVSDAEGVKLASPKPLVVPILRAGLGMVEGITQLIPSARVGHVGLFRDHVTLLPVSYYFKVPAAETDRDFFVLDPMLATGGSAVAAVSRLRESGATRVRFLCLVAAPEGVQAMLNAHPTVPVFAAALDRELNRQGYILPGLGDAGDRIFGTR